LCTQEAEGGVPERRKWFLSSQTFLATGMAKNCVKRLKVEHALSRNSMKMVVAAMRMLNALYRSAQEKRSLYV
jgi:hypothetical protein